MGFSMATLSRKQRCLFNTMHVKTALGLVTVFYLFGLALLDYHLFWQEMTDSESLVFSGVSILILLVIVTAQIGLSFEKYLLLFPFLIVQGLFLLIVYIIYSRSVAQQIFYAKMHPRVIVRLILIMMYEAIVTFMHTYALVINVRCIMYFRNKKLRNMDRLSFANRCFMDNMPRMKSLKDRIVNLKIDATMDDETIANPDTISIDGASSGRGSCDIFQRAYPIPSPLFWSTPPAEGGPTSAMTEPKSFWKQSRDSLPSRLGPRRASPASAKASFASLHPLE